MRTFVATVAVCLAAVAATVLYVDPAKRWHRKVGPVPRELAPGEVYAHPLDFDERANKRALAKQQPKAELALFGSSRVMLLRGDDLGKKTLNLGVSGGTLDDHTALYEALKAAGKLPVAAALYLDPWSFNRERDQDRWITLHAERARFVAEGSPDLSLRESLRPTATRATVAFGDVVELVGWISFKASLGALRRPAPKAPGVFRETDLADEDNGTRADGSQRELASRLLPPTEAHIAKLAKEHAAGPYGLTRAAWDDDAERVLTAFLALAKKDGVVVSVVLPPYQPETWAVLSKHAKHGAFLARYRETAARSAKAAGVPFCDAVDPAKSGCAATEFQDGMHPLPSCHRKVIAACTASAP